MAAPLSGTGKATSENFQQELQWAEGLDDEDLDALRQAHHDDTKIVLESPVRLGYYALLCLMVNRMIGMI
jgi:hypothetical protein